LSENSNEQKIRDLIRELAKKHLLLPEENSLENDGWDIIKNSIDNLHFFFLNDSLDYEVLKKNIQSECGSLSNHPRNEINKLIGNLRKNACDVFSIEQLEKNKNPNSDVIAHLKELCQNDKFTNFINNFSQEVCKICDEIGENVLSDSNTADSAKNIFAPLSDWQEYIDNARDSAYKAAKYAKQTAETANMAAGYAKQTADTAKKAAIEAKKAANEAKKAANEAKKTSDELLPSLLTAIGIFMAVLTTIAASYLTYKVGVNNRFMLPQVKFAFFVLTGQVLTNIIFTFMFMLSRMLEKDIAAECSQFKPSEGKPMNFKCRDCIGRTIKSRSHCLAVHKFPYIWYPNILMLLGYVFIFIWWFVDEFLY